MKMLLLMPVFKILAGAKVNYLIVLPKFLKKEIINTS